VVGVIGDPIAHSLSPLLHNAAFTVLGLDWVSVGFTVHHGQGAVALAGMRALGIAGLSVTMPHKEAALAAVDEASDVARRLGAVNCVTLRDGRLLGDSTDGQGFIDALRRGGGEDPAGRRCVVLGAGAAGRAVILALATAGAADVVVVNRDMERAVTAAALAGGSGRVGSAEDVNDADLVVHATPLGMAGVADAALALDPGRLHPGQVVVDLVYHPLRTALLRAAEERGAIALSGLGMLVHQAALALEHWTGQRAPLEAMWAAAAAATGEQPGS